MTGMKARSLRSTKIALVALVAVGLTLTACQRRVQKPLVTPPPGAAVTVAPLPAATAAPTASTAAELPTVTPAAPAAQQPTTDVAATQQASSLAATAAAIGTQLDQSLQQFNATNDAEGQAINALPTP